MNKPTVSVFVALVTCMLSFWVSGWVLFSLPSPFDLGHSGHPAWASFVMLLYLVFIFTLFMSIMGMLNVVTGRVSRHVQRAAEVERPADQEYVGTAKVRKLDPSRGKDRPVPRP